jgi:DNA adenine methylase
MGPVRERSQAGLEPLFRWPGGKRWLVPQLLRLVPNAIGTYHEPFFGGGALFFAQRPASAVLSDANRELIETYRTIRDSPADVADRLRGFPRDRDGYYLVRASRPTRAADRAARFIYLTTMAFSGIHRVNKRGEFNVPYGGRKYPGLGTEGSLVSYAAALMGARLEAQDFETALGVAVAGDFVYLDPPYTVAHGNNGFVRYNERIFSWKDQQRLASVAASLDRAGCHVVVSNAVHSSIQQLYSGFRSIPVSRRSLIAADPARRLVTDEVVFTNVG